MTRVTMPLEVREVYEQVNAATVQAATILENAKSFRNSLIPYTQGTVSQKIATANANQATAISDANLALAEFWGLLDEFKQNPDVVKTRVYNAKVTALLDIIGSIRVVQDGETKIFLNP
jgi:membrane protease subunit HflK